MIPALMSIKIVQNVSYFVNNFKQPGTNIVFHSCDFSSKIIFSEKSLSVPMSVCPFVRPSRPVQSRHKKKLPKQKISLNKVVRCISRVTKIHSEPH